MKLTWKQANIHNMEVRYGGLAKDFMSERLEEGDERLDYIKLYNKIIDALESLPDEPVEYVRLAMWYRMAKDKEILNGIMNRCVD